MRSAKYALEIADSIIDVDVAPSGSFRALSKRELNGGGEHAFEINFDGQRIPIPLPRNTHMSGIRAFGDERAVIFRRDPHGNDNAQILDRNGRILSVVDVGWVEDVVVVGNRIVVAYHDEGIYRTAIGSEGINVFSNTGTHEFGYHTRYGHEHLRIDDVDCAVARDENGLVFAAWVGLGSSEFVIVDIDLESRTQSIYPMPPDLHGARAISSDRETVYLASLFSNGVYAFKRDRQEFALVGEIEGDIRGVPGGRFLRRESDGYTIITMDEDAG